MHQHSFEYVSNVFKSKVECKLTKGDKYSNRESCIHHNSFLMSIFLKGLNKLHVASFIDTLWKALLWRFEWSYMKFERARMLSNNAFFVLTFHVKFPYILELRLFSHALNAFRLGAHSQWVLLQMHRVLYCAIHFEMNTNINVERKKKNNFF